MWWVIERQTAWMQIRFLRVGLFPEFLQERSKLMDSYCPVTIATHSFPLPLISIDKTGTVTTAEHQC